jgi:signal transduction histidine kinase
MSLAGVTTVPARATYAETVTGEAVHARWWLAGQQMARAVVHQGYGGLGRVLTGPDPAPPWSGRPAPERRAAYLALGTATLALCIVNTATVHGLASAHGQLPAGSAPVPGGLLPPTLAQHVLAVAVVAPLLLACWYPMLAWRLGWIGLLLTPLAPASWWGGWPWGPPQILALLAAFCLAGLRQLRPALWCMWALTIVPWLAWLVADVSHVNGPVAATIVFTMVVVAVDSVGVRLGAQRALTVQTERTEAERAQRAVLEERARIARELHDIVAHHMSLVAVRAETAPYRLTGLPDAVRAEFASLSDVAREALADMRRLLGVLRDDQRADQPAALAPQPRLSDLPALIDAARQAGVAVELSLRSALDLVPSAVGVCAYRIVQESLSNATQHAPGTPVMVSVDQDPAAVVLQVASGPGVPSGPAGDGRRPGHGIAGMRERVALLGGSLSAGPAPDGRFVVSAVLPLGDADTVAAENVAGTS